MSRPYQLYRTPEKECSIIQGRTRQDVLVILESADLGAAWPQLNTELHAKGFWLRFAQEIRRPPFSSILHTTFNREACPTCKACKPSRISIPDFVPTDAQKKLIVDSPYSVQLVKKPDADEHLQLAKKYQSYRHPEGNDDVEEFWTIRKRHTECLEIRNENGELVAGILFQMKPDIAVGDYYYYSPAQQKNFPQMPLYLKLALLEHLKETESKYLYLGVWTDEASPYTPKARLPGLEIIEGFEWRRLSSKERKAAMSAYYKKFSPDS